MSVWLLPSDCPCFTRVEWERGRKNRGRFGDPPSRSFAQTPYPTGSLTPGVVARLGGQSSDKAALHDGQQRLLIRNAQVDV